MKRTTLTLMIAILSIGLVKAQSKFSYTLQFNTSASLDDEVVIFVSGVGSGATLDLKPDWKPGITAAINYHVNSRLRIQTGIGYNRVKLDRLNETLQTSRYKLDFLSIPVRAHYFLNQGRFRFYTGVGMRADIRTGSRLEVISGHHVGDNTENVGLSFEALLGVQLPLNRRFIIQLEPVFSQAITSYTDEDNFSITPFSPGALQGIIDQKPTRIGLTLGLTYVL